MDIENKKRFKKLYDAKKVRITVSMNPYEKSILDTMMYREGWKNVGGFIKHKLLGLDYAATFKDTVDSAEEEELKRILLNLFSHLSDQLDYVNRRYEEELVDMKRTTPMVDRKSVSKWLSLLNNWNIAVENKIASLLYDLSLVLKRMNIIVERNQQDNLRGMPDSVLEQYARDWNDTSSPEFLEYTRRMLERTEKKK